MKKIAIAPIVAFLLAGPLATLSAESLVLTTVVDPAAPENAFLLSLATAIFKENGADASFRQAPAETSLRDADAGKTDGELGRIAGFEAEYHNLVMVPEPIQSTVMWAVAAKKYTVSGIDDIIRQGLSIVTVQGNRAAESNVQSRIASGRYLVAHGYDEALGMLVAGRVDVLIGNDVVLRPYLARPEYAGLTIAGILFTYDTYIYLNRKWAALVPGIAASIKKLKTK
jgi:ABC-type amino acid transport substrate-binding protein